MAHSQKKGPVTKEKLRSIMEAASALTALGDEESTGSRSHSSTPEKKLPATLVQKGSAAKNDDESSPTKRYIPEHKKPDAALTFPEKLMNLMRYAEVHKDDEDTFCIAWLPDGKSFIIRNPDEFTRQVLPKFFKATKFSSFTRKLYRWGFRQVNRGIGPDDPIIFGNEHFQRDNAEEMSNMRSITAASQRKAEVAQVPQNSYGGKRPLGMAAGAVAEGPDHKRALLDQLIQQKAASLMCAPNMYGGHLSQGNVSLTSALRPSLGLGVQQGNAFNNSGLPAMMSKHMDIMGQQNSNSLISNYMPQSHNQMNAQSYPSNASTADIVNAAISALRYAS